MDSRGLSRYASNFLIMIPAIATFIYIFPYERNYWQPWVIVFFIIPFVKYMTPKDHRSQVYPLVLLGFSVYFLFSAIRAVNLFTFPFEYLFIAKLTQNAISSILFTFSSGVVFTLIIEGVLSKKTSKTISYLVVAITSTIYFTAAVSFATLAHISFLNAYNFTEILLLENILSLIVKGYEFLTLLVHPTTFILYLLTTTFVVSIIGVIWNLYLYEERQYKITLDYLGFPILSGAIFAIILALILDYIPYPVYSLLVTSVVVISSIFLVKRKDKKDNYELRIMDVNEPRHN